MIFNGQVSNIILPPDVTRARNVEGETMNGVTEPITTTVGGPARGHDVAVKTGGGGGEERKNELGKKSGNGNKQME